MRRHGTRPTSGPRAALVAFALATAALARADVVTRVSGSRLVVTGDDGPDTVEISSAADGVRVVGSDGTLVDGSSAGVSVPGVDALTVRLRGGADRLTLATLRLRGRLYVSTGRGSDRVALDDVHAGRTRIVTGDGPDRVTATDSRFGRLVVDTGNGNDDVLVDGVWVAGILDVFTFAGDDDVEIADSEIGDDVDVRLGDDDDELVLEDVDFDEDANLDGGGGDDDLFADDVFVDGDVEVDGFDDDWWP